MKFPSLEFVQALQERMNGDAAFHTASRWSDVKVLLCFGDQRYWLKLYGGKIIDAMDYFPMANPLGWDYMISAPLEIWRALRDGSHSATVSAAQSDDRGSLLPECDGCRLVRRPCRGRESDDLALRPRGRRQSPDQRSTRRSDWK